MIDDRNGSVQYESRIRSDDASTGLRAAQYVRMSTDNQRYSTQNQADAIAAYAAQRGFTVVRTYKDEGRSGLLLHGRDALQNLLTDVRSGRAGFETILVYDVSRWGRFQDADESAYYEFICKQAGIQVHYCAEQFENDGSLFSTMYKNMKRAMAGEWSRELSAKVFAGQSRLVKLGLRQGGQPGYGLQRVLIGPDRSPKGILRFRERKSIQSDRVILQPGLPHEVDTVKRIFHLFTQDSKTKQEIADQLNKENIPNQLGRPWVRSSIQRMLSNEKYIGNNVYNLTSSKLGQKNARNPSSVWMRVEGAFERIIDPATFEAAQRIMAQRRLEKPPREGILKNSEILSSLAQLFAEKGCLTTEMINAAGGLPHSTLYRKRFGSLKQAYELVGYQQEKNFQYYDGRRAVTATIASVAAELSTQIRMAGRSVDFDERTSTLTTNDAATVSIFVARSVRLPTGSLRWKIGRKIGRCSNLVVVARMKETNESILDYHLLPHSEIPERRIEFQDWPRFDAFRIEVGEDLAQAILSSLGLGPSV